MAKSGMNPKTLQYLMGHSDISVTMKVHPHMGLDDAEDVADDDYKNIQYFIIRRKK